MEDQNEKHGSISGLRLDLATAKILVWVVSLGRDAELTSDAHIYFFDRYQRLADYHRLRATMRERGAFRPKLTSIMSSEAEKVRHTQRPWVCLVPGIGWRPTPSVAAI